jgi:hypothetical protein
VEVSFAVTSVVVAIQIGETGNDFREVDVMRFQQIRRLGKSKTIDVG